MDDLAVQGIQAISGREIADWKANGLVPKLVGSLVREGDTLRAGVDVRAYPSSDPFAQVSGKNKAIRIATDAMGDIVAIGCGAEPRATAASALKDLEHILHVRSRRPAFF